MKSQSRSSTRRVIATERQLDALELRKQGLSYAEIGAKMGISMQAANKLVLKALKAYRKKAKEETHSIIDIEVQRLDLMVAALKDRIAKGDTKAIDSAVRIMDRRAKLLGLDGASTEDEEDLRRTFVVKIKEE